MQEALPFLRRDVVRKMEVTIEGQKYNLELTLRKHLLVIKISNYPEIALIANAMIDEDDDDNLVITGFAIRTKFDGNYAVPVSAKAFLNFAIKYFERIWKRPVKKVHAHWCEDEYWGDNYRDYEKGIAQGLKPIDAAAKTWTGRILAKNGFLATSTRLSGGVGVHTVSTIFTRE